MSNDNMNREKWLTKAMWEMNHKLFNGRLPENVRVTCSFAYGSKKAAGQVFHESVSDGGIYEIFITPEYEDKVDVLATLAHEMVHIIVGIEEGHGKKFKDLAVAVGLTGKMTATRASDSFIEFIETQMNHLPDYPHHTMNVRGETVSTTGAKKQSTRMLKAECPECGYTVRLTKKWLAVGAPICPAHSDMVIEGE